MRKSSSDRVTSPTVPIMSIGTIWWDFDGTLISRPAMWSAAGCRCLTRLSPEHSVTRDQLRFLLKRGFPWHRPDHGHPELTPKLWWEAVGHCYSAAFDQLGCRIDNLKDLLAAIRADILDARHYLLFDDVVPVLARLHRGGWQQVIVSNHVPELEAIVTDLGIRRFFRAVLTSAIVGYEKPHARMFEAALQHSVPNRPVWMIGDNVELDCIASEAFGAKAILVRSARTFVRHAPDLWAALNIIEP
jgi:putative hydrolase of the HAD superfamily